MKHVCACFWLCVYALLITMEVIRIQKCWANVIVTVKLSGPFMWPPIHLFVCVRVLFILSHYECLTKHTRRYSCGVYVMWRTLILILSLNFINHTLWCPVLAKDRIRRESKEFSPISIVSIFVTMKTLWSERNLRKILIQIIKYFKIQQTMDMHPQRWPATKSVRVQRVNYNALCT